MVGQHDDIISKGYFLSYHQAVFAFSRADVIVIQSCW